MEKFLFYQIFLRFGCVKSVQLSFAQLTDFVPEPETLPPPNVLRR